MAEYFFPANGSLPRFSSGRLGLAVGKVDHGILRGIAWEIPGRLEHALVELAALLRTVVPEGHFTAGVSGVQG